MYSRSGSLIFSAGILSLLPTSLNLIFGGMFFSQRNVFPETVSDFEKEVTESGKKVLAGSSKVNSTCLK